MDLYFNYWIHHSLFSGFSYQHHTLADCLIPNLYDSILDFKHHSYDLLDSFLGRNGVFNTMLESIGLIDEPLEFLLFSDFSIVLAFVHLYALFMVVPIFNSMMRIDRSLIEAAIDGGANGWQMITNVIIPLCKPGIAIGSIFVVTLVMGDYITVRLMGGGQRASVGLMMWNEISLLQYPAAAAHAVVLLAVVMIMVSLMMRVVDLKKEL